MSSVMRKQFFAYAKTKAQISNFVFALGTSYIQNFKPQAILCDCTAGFV